MCGTKRIDLDEIPWNDMASERQGQAAPLTEEEKFRVLVSMRTRDEIKGMLQAIVRNPNHSGWQRGYLEG